MKSINKCFLALLMSASFSCSTMVHITSEPSGAKTFLNKQQIGQTPVAVNLSNFFTRNYSIALHLEGYDILRTNLKKEMKPGAFFGAIFALLPILWVAGPAPKQHYVLNKTTAMNKTRIINNFKYGKVYIDGELVPHDTIKTLSSGTHEFLVMRNGQTLESVKVWLNSGTAYELK